MIEEWPIGAVFSQQHAYECQTQFEKSRPSQPQPQLIIITIPLIYYSFENTLI